jgi:glycosyltransferase involved in cell wall biosynthesis
MPLVSIILPTFNRADTIVRAIRSVQAQTWQDWELIVVDDGSTDATAANIANLDPRIVLICQANRGFTEARNTAIRAARGRYYAFIDSDDEFLPHHLELCVAFLESFTAESFVSTELLEDFGHGRVVNHYQTETSTWYPRKAALVGSRRLDLPPGETDDYRRVYQSREPIGAWGRHITEPLDPGQRAWLYRGWIFEYLRYDFLITITATVMRCSVFAELGLPEARWGMGSDFHFMARLARAFRTNYISLPTFIKHEYAPDGQLPAHGHAVTGKSTLRFGREWQAAWDDLFWTNSERDAELRGLRCLRFFWMAQTALRAGDRLLTRQYVQEARRDLPRFAPAIALDWLVRTVPSTTLVQHLYELGARLEDYRQRLLQTQPTKPPRVSKST